MKKFKLFKMLAVLIVLITSINTAWAGYNWFGNVFFRAPDDWDLDTYSHVQIGLVQKTDVTTNGYIWYSGDMSRVGDTRLFYLYLGVDHGSFSKEWVIFTANSSTYGTTGDGGMKINANGQYTTPADYGFSNNDFPYLFNPNSEDNGAAVTGSCVGAKDDGKDYDARRYELLNKAQTINLYTNASSSNSGGSVKIDGYYVSGNTAVTSGSATSSTTSVSYNTGIGTTVTLTATPAEGYCFLGWYTAASDGTQLSSSTTYTYTCTGEKTVYALFAEKLPVGKTLYLATNSKWRENSATFEAVFCNATTQLWETCSLLDGTDDMYSVTVPSGDWGFVIFARMNPSGTAKSWSGRWCQTSDMYKDGIKNCVYITGDCSNSQRWGKYAPVPAIVGTMNNWDPVASGYQFTDGQLVLSNLSANSGYQFKVAVGRDDYWYGYGGSDNTNTYVGQTTAITLTANYSDMAIATAGAGNYTFKWDSENHKLKVEFPSVEHPSTDYVYVNPYSDWDPVNAHLYGGTYGTVWTYDPGLSSVTIYGNTYYYTALGDHNKIIFGSGVSDSHKTESLGEGDHESDAPTSHKGRFYDASDATYANWAWKDFTATLALDHQSATNTPAPNSLTVKFNKSDNLTGDVITTSPAKNGYTFGGYYTQSGGGGSQLIGTNENVVASISGYTDANKKWIRTGEDATTTIYAKWTQSITLNQNGATTDGSTSLAATYNAVLDASGITNPSKDYYTFKGWTNGTGGSGDVVIDENKDVKTVASWTDGSDKWIHNGASTLYAKWDEDTHTVGIEYKCSGTSIHDNGSVAGVGADTKQDAEAVDITGYDFSTWSAMPSGVTTSDALTSSTIAINATAEDKTITANYTRHVYSGTIDATGGTADGSYSVTYLDKQIVVAVGDEPIKAGYHVSGYYLDEDCTKPLADGGGNFYVSVSIGDDKYTNDKNEWIYDGNPKLYVTWAENTITINLDDNKGGDDSGTAGSTTRTVTMDRNNYSSITLPTRTGYDFAGYYASDGTTMVFNSDGEPVKSTGYIDGSSNWINASTVTLYAHWTAKTYTVTFHSRYGSAVSDVTATYNSGTLSGTPVSTKWGNDFGGWWTNPSGTGTEVISSAGALKTSVTGYTDGSGNWTHDGAVDLYAKWTPKSNLYWISGDGAGYSSGTSFISAGDNKYYVKVDMSKDEKFHLGDGESVGGPSSNTDFTLDTYEQSVGANSTYFNYNGTQKQTFVFVLDIYTLRLSFENFVIYRSSSDKDDDPHTAYGSVAGYSGTIYGDFELRIPVDGINKWSTLCLPFKPTKVQAWGGSVYHDLYPCHRKDDGLLYQGYYVIRTPERTTDLSIEDFKQWNDPGDYREGGNYWTPAAETPYIIQWQNKWFMDRYISYWGNDETIRASFVAGSAPTAEGVVNVLGNATMGSGSVKGAYVLTEEYGDGAWLRDEDPEKSSAVGPFECYIRANGTTTENNLVIKRRTGDDTTTGLDEILNYEIKEVITVYTISGLRVAQYNDCSFEEAGRRMNAELSEGIYIMNAGNESVKLIIR